MSAKAESQGSALDLIKSILAVALVAIAIVGFYIYSDVSFLYRVLGLVTVLLLATGIALSTNSGKNLLAFMKNARAEVRKMVWPTRVETIQTTLLVFVIVIMIAIFLWIVDMLLGWGIGSLLR